MHRWRRKDLVGGIVNLVRWGLAKDHQMLVVVYDLHRDNHKANLHRLEGVHIPIILKQKACERLKSKWKKITNIFLRLMDTLIFHL